MRLVPPFLILAAAFIFALRADQMGLCTLLAFPIGGLATAYFFMAVPVIRYDLMIRRRARAVRAAREAAVR